MIKPKISEIYSASSDARIPKIYIDSVVPINTNVIINNGEGEECSLIARITWLCRKTNGTGLICLTTTYVLEDEEDEDFIAMLPILDDNNYENYHLASTMMISTLPHYLTDLKFSFDFKEDDTADIWCIGIVNFGTSNDDGNNHLVEIHVNPDQFASLSYIDNYMLERVVNNGDFHIAVTTGASRLNRTKMYRFKHLYVKNVGLIKGYSKKDKHLIANIIVSKTPTEEIDYLYHQHEIDVEIEYLRLVTLINIGDQKIKNKKIVKDKAENIIKKFVGEDSLSNYIHRLTFTVDKFDLVNGEIVEDYDTFIKATNIETNESLIFVIDPDLRYSFEHDLIALLDGLLVD